MCIATSQIFYTTLVSKTFRFGQTGFPNNALIKPVKFQFLYQFHISISFLMMKQRSGWKKLISINKICGKHFTVVKGYIYIL